MSCRLAGFGLAFAPVLLDGRPYLQYDAISSPGRARLRPEAALFAFSSGANGQLLLDAKTIAGERLHFAPISVGPYRASQKIPFREVGISHFMVVF